MDKKENSFQCGACMLYEEGLTAKEVIELSGYHFSGKHIDIYELRKIKRKAKEKDK